MKKRRSRNPESLELDINMTPMIDIVFQLLIFFVLTAKFIQHEGELRSYLPKNRGDTPNVKSTIDLANVTIYLDWEWSNKSRANSAKGPPPGEGWCVAETTDYQPASGENDDQHRFIQVSKSARPYPANKAVNYDYPDFQAIEDYIKYRGGNYSGIGFGLPVTVNFSEWVPVQMVINMVDICVKLGIKDFALNAQGEDIQ